MSHSVPLRLGRERLGGGGPATVSAAPPGANSMRLPGRRATPVSWPLAAGLAILAVYAAVAILAGQLAPYDPSAYSRTTLAWPSAAHLLGTNDVGQDILSELIYGSRLSLTTAAVSATAALGLAIACGTAAGYAGGWIDMLLMRLVDVLLALPQLPLLIVLAIYLPPSPGTTILLIAILGWTVPARAIRAQTLALRSLSYVTAARHFGGRPAYLIRRHLLPALSPILVATFVALAARAVMLEAGLALLGLGDPLAKSWGSIIRAALSYKGIYFTPHWAWWLLPPALSITLVVLGFTLAGIGIETRQDPRLWQTVATTTEQISET